MKSLFTGNVKKINQYIADKKAEREEKKREISLSFAAQDSMDILSYSGLEEHSKYLVIDGRYVKTISIAGFPLTAHMGWLDNLVNFNSDIDVAYHIDSIDASAALKKLHRKITELETQRRAMERDGRIVGTEITDPLLSAMELRDAIMRGHEKLFLVSIYATLSAPTLEQLEKKAKLLDTVLGAHLFYTKDASFRQLDGLQSILPRAENLLAQKRNLDSSSAALTFPFVSSELVQENGILYGVNISNNSLVILDRFSLNNANSIVFAQSGSGKSYATKVEILRQLMQGTKVIVIDPEREYAQLTKSVSGTYIKVSAGSKDKINPLDYKRNDEEGAFSDYIQTVVEIIGLMVDELNSAEKAALDKAIIKVHQKNKQPLMGDLYAELKALKQTTLCNKLEKYVSGSLKQVFNAPTSVKLDNQLIVFDIKDMPKELRQIMMMVIANFVQGQVMDEPQKRLLIIDEGWLLLEHEQSAHFVTGLVRRARKYYLGVSIISQQANDFLGNEHGRAIASQSALRILMRQDTTTIKNVAKHFNLSDYEQNFLLTCGTGEALIIADQNHVALRVVASEDEHPLITTNPAELYAQSV